MCRHLENVTFQEGSELRIIGSSCFSRSSIEQIVIPRNVTALEEWVFQYCEKLKNVQFQQDS